MSLINKGGSVEPIQRNVLQYQLKFLFYFNIFLLQFYSKVTYVGRFNKVSQYKAQQLQANQDHEKKEEKNLEPSKDQNVFCMWRGYV